METIAPMGWHGTQFSRLLRDRETLPHALLLHGQQGIGKAVFAHALAQALLCEASRADGGACGVCSACGWVARGTHPDWLRIQTGTEGEGAEQGGEKSARQITIDQIRLLPDFISMSSHRGGAKVVLLQPAEALNPNAANALLKSLEEPPANTFFILVSNRPNFLLATIKSRCRQIALPAPERAAAEAWLEAQAVPNASLALAQAGGAPLLAAQLVDSDWWAQRATLLETISARQFDPLAAAERLRDAPIPMVIGCLQKWTYDLISQRFLGMVRYNPDYAAAVSAGARIADILGLLRFHRHLVRMQRIVDHPLNPRLVIEDLFLAYSRLLQAPSRSPR